MLHIVIFIGFLLAWKRKIIIDFLKSILKYYYPDRKSSRIQIRSTMKFERITSNFEKIFGNHYNRTKKILTVCSPLFISWLVLLCLRALACCVWKFPEIDVNDPISFWKMTFSMLQLCNNAKKLTRTCKSWQYIKKSSERRWSADSDWKKMSWNYWWCNTAFFRCKVFTL